MVHTRSQTQASRDSTRAYVQSMRDARRTRMMTDASQAQNQSMKDAAQFKVDQYIASCKPITNQMQRMTPLSTPVKQPQQYHTTIPTAPIKQNRYNTRSSTKSNPNEELNEQEQETTIQKHKYNTRLSSGSIQKTNLNMDLSTEFDELSTTTIPTILVFDAAFFDDASRAWNQNKTKLGNGMYAYNTRSASKKN
jgi:hypothetical protein